MEVIGSGLIHVGLDHEDRRGRRFLDVILLGGQERRQGFVRLQFYRGSMGHFLGIVDRFLPARSFVRRRIANYYNSSDGADVRGVLTPLLLTYRRYAPLGIRAGRPRLADSLQRCRNRTNTEIIEANKVLIKYYPLFKFLYWR